MTEKPERIVYCIMEILMQDELKGHPDLLAETFRPVFDKIIKPGEIRTNVTVYTAPGSGRERKLTNKSWEDTERSYKTGQVHALVIDSATGVYQETCQVLYCLANTRNLPIGRRPSFFVLSINRELLDINEIIDLVIKEGEEVFSLCGGINGYISLSHNWLGWAFQSSEYQQLLNMGSKLGRDYTSELRGYYWGNFLGPGHITKLGGLGAIRESGIFHIVHELPNGVYLQLTPFWDTASPEDFRRCRDFLGPLLPKAEYIKERVGTPFPSNFHLLEYGEYISGQLKGQVISRPGG